MAGVELLASLEPDQLTLSGILGTGAYAVVYRGSLRLMTDRGESLVRCAVKVLQPDAGIVGGKEAIRMFAEEAKILRECSHRYIPKLYGAVRIPPGFPGLAATAGSSVWALCQELCSQGSLAQLLQKQLLTPWNFIYDSVQALAWSMQVAEALQHMHAGGVLHRDIKAENVLLTWEGRELVARLADLGLHRRVTQDTPTNQAAVTTLGSSGLHDPALHGQHSSQYDPQLPVEHLETSLYSQGHMQHPPQPSQQHWQMPEHAAEAAGHQQQQQAAASACTSQQQQSQHSQHIHDQADRNQQGAAGGCANSGSGLGTGAAGQEFRPYSGPAIMADARGRPVTSPLGIMAAHEEDDVDDDPHGGGGGSNRDVGLHMVQHAAALPCASGALDGFSATDLADMVKQSTSSGVLAFLSAAEGIPVRSPNTGNESGMGQGLSIDELSPMGVLCDSQRDEECTRGGQGHGMLHAAHRGAGPMCEGTEKKAAKVYKVPRCAEVKAVAPSNATRAPATPSKAAAAAACGSRAAQSKAQPAKQPGAAAAAAQSKAQPAKQPGAAAAAASPAALDVAPEDASAVPAAPAAGAAASFASAAAEPAAAATASVIATAEAVGSLATPATSRISTAASSQHAFSQFPLSMEASSSSISTATDQSGKEPSTLTSALAATLSPRAAMYNHLPPSPHSQVRLLTGLSGVFSDASQRGTNHYGMLPPSESCAGLRSRPLTPLPAQAYSPHPPARPGSAYIAALSQQDGQQHKEEEQLVPKPPVLQLPLVGLGPPGQIESAHGGSAAGFSTLGTPRGLPMVPESTTSRTTTASLASPSVMGSLVDVLSTSSIARTLRSRAATVQDIFVIEQSDCTATSHAPHQVPSIAAATAAAAGAVAHTPVAATIDANTSSAILSPGSIADKLPLGGPPPVQPLYQLTGQTGSCMYMAPEVHLGLPYNHSADVFSFGMLLYEVWGHTLLAVSHIDIRIPTWSQMLHSAEQFADAVASGFRPARLKAIPDLIWELICDCTHKDTAARPRINQVLQRLQGYEGELLHATPAAGENKCGCILS